ncbi:hypothetical protein SAMN05443575_0170 [Jatrophihabitans endophyticus]|uniref:Uncharacterized protein n=1 Tax=Jatrophihabitans endophyticus TaxID=1206085 RepID=A0A1M5CAJ7_9ACTN|nr:hypothetical protein [Jatrophihabitans endophyticus]SHF51765.1 hypothetical protein SAMN05443575_0170 [Jatrophihabitans endophyticus]
MAAHEGDDGPVEYVALGDATKWVEIEDDDAPDPRRTRRVRLLVAACVLGGLVIVAIVVLGVRLLVGDLSRSPHERTVDAIRDRYQQRYSDCVDAGTGARPCAATVAKACLADPRWGRTDAQEVLDACTLGRTP